MFKRRVGGVYFAIITQAIAAILTILIIGRQGCTGGVNGITDLKTLLGWDIRTDQRQIHPLLRQLHPAVWRDAPRADRAGEQARAAAAGHARQGRPRALLRLRRRQLQGVRLLLAAALAAVGGAMFTLQVGFMSPSFVGIVPSIEMVIFCAVGGRDSLVGAVYGTLLVNWGKTFFSEKFPQLWLFLMGGLFIGVVMALPARPGRSACTDQIDPAR